MITLKKIWLFKNRLLIKNKILKLINSVLDSLLLPLESKS